LDPHFGPRALFGLALGTVIGGALQLGVQLPSLFRAGYRFRPDWDWNDDGVRAIVRMMGPAIVAASSVQVNVLVNTWFASWLEDGTAYRLNIAFRLMQLPLGLFGVAVGTVTLPLLSRIAAKGDRSEFGSVLGHGLRLALMLTLPATVGLVMLARPILSLLYEHGRFDAHATDQAALALQGYALGLCAYSALKVLVPAFYAIDRRRTPMMVSFISIALNAGVNWYFAFVLRLGIRGLALGTGIVAVTNFVLLYLLMRKETQMLATRELFSVLTRLALASAALGVVCWASQTWLLGSWPTLGLFAQALYLLATIAVGVAVFLFAATLLGIDEINEVLEALRRKLGRIKAR
ncbi:MAG TPA: murein biosynthesis integral membrane protein MurJ, partial [Chthoniobacteraceae bacterium]|nr:murein biosynthesis integral membrane protein MurJ [Chthoniobacteraceae bacterium]